MSISYKQLKENLSMLTEEQLQQTAMIFVPGIDEYFPVWDNLTITDENCDTLDPGHIVLTIA